jgi:hypothetical protein
MQHSIRRQYMAVSAMLAESRLLRERIAEGNRKSNAAILESNKAVALSRALLAHAHAKSLCHDL